MRNSKFKNSPDLSLLTFGYQRGQSLFELVVAIAISALIVVAMVSLATNSIKNSQFSKNKALASSYAQQATEWLRGERDSDFVAFKNNVELSMYPSKRCLNNLVWTINQCGSEIMDGTPFKREVIFPEPARYSVSSDCSPIFQYGIPGVTYGAGGITPFGVYSMYDGAKGEVLGLDNLYKMTQSYMLALIDLCNQPPT